MLGGVSPAVVLAPSVGCKGRVSCCSSIRYSQTAVIHRMVSFHRSCCTAAAGAAAVQQCAYVCCVGVWVYVFVPHLIWYLCVCVCVCFVPSHLLLLYSITAELVETSKPPYSYEYLSAITLITAVSYGVLPAQNYCSWQKKATRTGVEIRNTK